jgi:2-polyprenyl-6-methoxyphenol hydroxylase-like FAD-dependent oxidoreductase
MRFFPSHPKSRPLAIAIIGGGIGGLAAALALRRHGFNAVVYERAPDIREVGAGLGVWANALRVLDQLGVGAQLRALGQPVEAAGIFSHRGEALSVSDLTELSREVGAPSFVLHRGDLQRELRAALPAEAIVTWAECRGYRTLANGRVQVQFLNQAPIEADLVIGADGFNSVIRTQLCGPTPVRYSGQTCYRGVVRMPVDRPGLLAEIQGPGRRLGHCPLGPDRMYWWACINAPRGEGHVPVVAKAQLTQLFRDWPFGLPDFIAATPADQILRNDLCDRPPLTRWSRGHVTLLGDAAHPMLPNLGQGACTAIEDAAVLAQCLLQDSNIEDALIRYEAERIPRTTRMVELSWNFGRLARLSQPAAVRLREWALRLTPASLMQKELRWQLGYNAVLPASPS